MLWADIFEMIFQFFVSHRIITKIFTALQAVRFCFISIICNNTSLFTLAVTRWKHVLWNSFFGILQNLKYVRMFEYFFRTTWYTKSKTKKCLYCSKCLTWRRQQLSSTQDGIRCTLNQLVQVSRIYLLAEIWLRTTEIFSKNYCTISKDYLRVYFLSFFNKVAAAVYTMKAK